MKMFAGFVSVLALGAGLGAWSSLRPPAFTSSVGTDPGGVAPGRRMNAMEPAPGDSLVAFSSGCFWGAESAFRHIPGIVATAVGYTGGRSAYPSYEVAHATGHLETVLVEFDPRRTPFSALMRTFWTLPRSTSNVVPGRVAVWTYDAAEQRLATASRDAMELQLHHPLHVRISPAPPFYLAEAEHQQYNERAGKELCPTVP